MQAYPTTLSDIPKHYSAWHVCAEHRGHRFHLGTEMGNLPAMDLLWKYVEGGHSGVSLFLTNKSDSTRIHGGVAEFEAALAKCK